MQRISIGMPVYNGENYISEAIASIVAQTYQNFELIISDNCSNDNTEEICMAYASRDSRIRYVRQNQNIGAAPNFNFLFDLCSGEFFKWAAHDDLLAPTYIEKCVARLEANPAAVLCFTGAQIIDANGDPIKKYENPLNYLSCEPEKRFSQLVQFHKSARYEIFGVFRRSVLENTSLIGGFTDGDGVLLAHVGLRGLFEEVAEDLFFPRRHEGQSQRLIANKQDYDTWFDPINRNKWSFPHFRILREFIRVVALEPLRFSQKLACYGSVFRQGLRQWRLLRGDIKRFVLRLVCSILRGLQRG